MSGMAFIHYPQHTRTHICHKLCFSRKILIGRKFSDAHYHSSVKFSGEKRTDKVIEGHQRSMGGQLWLILGSLGHFLSQITDRILFLNCGRGWVMPIMIGDPELLARRLVSSHSPPSKAQCLLSRPLLSRWEITWENQKGEVDMKWWLFRVIPGVESLLLWSLPASTKQMTFQWQSTIPPVWRHNGNPLFTGNPERANVREDKTNDFSMAIQGKSNPHAATSWQGRTGVNAQEYSAFWHLWQWECICSALAVHWAL